MPFPIQTGEWIEDSLQFALLLRDGFAQSDQLLGGVTVKAGAVKGQQKGSSGTFLFEALKPGSPTLQVSCGPDTPYYLPKTIPVTVPMPAPLWPAFPDLTLANPNLPLDDPGQSAAYKNQRQDATLLPANGYPFAAGTTLIRGTVLHAGKELAGATVQQGGGGDPSYTTGPDGQFVLFLSSPPGLPTTVTVTATFPGSAAVSANVTVVRGSTVSVTINL